jgi:hypothetical protein
MKRILRMTEQSTELDDRMNEAMTILAEGWKEVPNRFTYSIVLENDQTYDLEYDIFAVIPPPQKPPISEEDVEKGSIEWYQWREYNIYLAAKERESKRLRAIEKLLVRVSSVLIGG